jgi:hypothetical protein
MNVTAPGCAEDPVPRIGIGSLTAENVAEPLCRAFEIVHSEYGVRSFEPHRRNFLQRHVHRQVGRMATWTLCVEVVSPDRSLSPRRTATRRARTRERARQPDRGGDAERGRRRAAVAADSRAAVAARAPGAAGACCSARRTRARRARAASGRRSAADRDIPAARSQPSAPGAPSPSVPPPARESPHRPPARHDEPARRLELASPSLAGVAADVSAETPVEEEEDRLVKPPALTWRRDIVP